MNALSLFSGIGGIDLACEWAPQIYPILAAIKQIDDLINAA